MVVTIPPHPHPYCYSTAFIQGGTPAKGLPKAIDFFC